MKKHNVIGEGSYGCVIKPELKCDSDKQIITKNNSKNNISKLFEKKKNYINEFKLAKKMSKIDPSGKNMLIPTYGCASSYENIISNTNDIKYNCDLDIYNYNNYYHLVMPYGGKDMDDYFRENKTNCKEFLNIIKPLFEAVKLLIDKKYCHQDIKFYNVLVSPQKKAMLIDYGLMKPFKDIYNIEKNGSRLKYTYAPHPPEYKLLYYFDYDVNTFISEVIINLKKIKEVYLYKYISQKDIYDKLHKMYNKYHSLAKNKTELSKILFKFADKMDVYSIGIIFVKMNKYIDCNNYKDLINKLIEFDPELRISCENTIRELNKMIKM